MTDKLTPDQAQHGNTQKDPKDWVTGDEPMTGAQHSYLHTLCEEAKENFDDSLSKAGASKRIEELQAKTGRGVSRPEKHEPAESAGARGAEPASDRDESPVESLGRSIGGVVLGAEPRAAGDEATRRS